MCSISSFSRRRLISSFAVLWCLLTSLSAHSYIHKVYEYRPAPGQFVNAMPAATAEDTPATMAAKADSAIANHRQGMISLGGYGGYVVFGFDHEVQNVAGAYDFKVLGNSFYTETNSTAVTRRGGSSEPGIVMVSRDDNHNGLPDDTWYELAGSEYYKPATRHHYTMTYYRTPKDHVATPDNDYRFLCDTTYIAWSSSEGEKGYLPQNITHKQDYFPLWLGDTLTFTGTILPHNGVDESGTGSYYVSYCLDWGYADNQPNDLPKEPAMHVSEFNIEWAVDDAGKPVHLDGIRFVKVYTAINQYNGWLGECSTEIMDAFDLHPCAATFEAEPNGISLSQVDTVWQGADEPVAGVNSWQSGGCRFATYLDNSWGADYYYAFTVSSETDSVSTGWEQPYRSACGGAYEGQNFCVWFQDFYGNDTIFADMDFTGGKGVMVTNTAYTAMTMRNGYRMSSTFSDDDYLQLSFVGYRGGEPTDTVTFMLAERGAYVRDWTFVDLSRLGKVEAVLLTIDGSDKTAGYLNTPAYAALDNFGLPAADDYVAPTMVRFDSRTAIGQVWRDDAERRDVQPSACKFVRDGMILIQRGNRTYNLQGQEKNNW